MDDLDRAAVGVPDPVRVAQGAGDAAPQVHRGADRHLAIGGVQAREYAGQGEPLDQLERQVGLVADVAVLVGADDVVVFEQAADAGLGIEAGARLVAAQQALVKPLDGEALAESSRTLELAQTRPRHPAAAQHPQHIESTESVPHFVLLRPTYGFPWGVGEECLRLSQVGISPRSAS